MKRAVCYSAVLVLSLLAGTDVLAQGQRSGGAQASSCYLYPQFVAPRFIHPEFERRVREKNDFLKPEAYRGEFVRPQFVRPEFVRPEFQPRQYLGCSGNRFQPVENGYKLAMIEYGNTQTNRAPQEAQAQLAVNSRPGASYQYTPPAPARDADCCGAEVELKPTPPEVRERPKIN